MLNRIDTHGMAFSAIATILITVAVAQLPADAQSASATQPTAPTTKICSSVPGAECLEEPAAETPVAPQYQASYQAYLKMKAAAHGGSATPTKLPDWSGVWQRDFKMGSNWEYQKTNPIANQGSGALVGQAIFDYCASFPCKGWITAELTPPYAKRFLEKLAAISKGVEWDHITQCLPNGFPRFLLDPYQTEFMVTSRETLWIDEQVSDVRRIYTDGRGHLSQDDGYPLWEGDSIGFWDGDTLVIHTIRTRAQEISRMLPAVSDQLSAIERVRMVDPNTIEDEATLWDPKALKAPWRGVHTYRRVTAKNARIDMWSCVAGNNVVPDDNGEPHEILPGEVMMVKTTAKDPDHAELVIYDRAVAYGAKLMKEGMKPGTKAGQPPPPVPKGE
jgi:hypothetical protein